MLQLEATVSITACFLVWQSFDQSIMPSVQAFSEYRSIVTMQMASMRSGSITLSEQQQLMSDIAHLSPTQTIAAEGPRWDFTMPLSQAAGTSAAIKQLLLLMRLLLLSADRNLHHANFEAFDKLIGEDFMQHIEHALTSRNVATLQAIKACLSGFICQ